MIQISSLRCFSGCLQILFLSQSHPLLVPILEFSSATTKYGRRGSVSSTPTIFWHLRQFLQFLRTTFTSCRNELPHPCVQSFLVDAMGGTIGFAVTVIAFADILHTAITIPISDHRNEWVAGTRAQAKSPA